MVPLVVETCWRSLLQVSKPAFQSQSLKVVGAVGLALFRVSINSVVRKSMMFSNVIVDIIIIIFFFFALFTQYKKNIYSGYS